MLENIIKTAFRNILRHKAYSFINVMGLAIGMTCCLLILIFIQDEFSYDKSHDNSQRIYRLVLQGNAAGSGRQINTARTASPWGPALAQDYQEVEEAVRFKTPLSRWLISNEMKRMYERGFYFADKSVFKVFDFELIRGNPETVLAGPNTVVLTESMARKYFGAEDPIGKILTADNAYDFAVTGVMKDIAKNSHLQFDFLASFATLEGPGNSAGAFIYGGNLSDFNNFGLFPQVYTYLLLQEGFSPSDFEEKLPAFMEKYIGLALEQEGVELRPYLQPVTEIHLNSKLEAEISNNSDISYVYIFSIIALFILIVACINFMNLATARSASRAREVGIRKVIGSNRSLIMRQFLGESVIMAFLSMVFALILVYALLPVFNLAISRQLVFTPDDPMFWGASILIVLFVGICAGSYPAFFLSAFEPANVLKGALSSGGTNVKLRQILVVIQFAISIIFIIGTGVVYRQLDYVQNRRLGFEKEQVLVIPMVDPPVRFDYLSYKNAILQNPHIVSVSAANSVPGGLVDIAIVRPEGTPDGETVSMEGLIVEHDFIRTLGIGIKQGRDFSMSFPSDTMEAFIINETAANQLGWNASPLGKRIDMGNFKRAKVIGVVNDFHLKSLHEQIGPVVIHLAINPDPFLNLLIRISPSDIAETIQYLEEKWHSVYPSHPFEYSFLEDDFAKLYVAEQQRGRVFIAFSLLAILIACLGLFGLSSFTAEQRTKEMGIRRVLGASVVSIARLLSQDFARLVLIANLIAWPIAYWLMQSWLQNFAFRTNIGIAIFFQAGLIALVIAIATVSYQSVKAGLTRPSEALKYE